MDKCLTVYYIRVTFGSLGYKVKQPACVVFATAVNKASLWRG